MSYQLSFIIWVLYCCENDINSTIPPKFFPHWYYSAGQTTDVISFSCSESVILDVGDGSDLCVLKLMSSQTC